LFHLANGVLSIAGNLLLMHFFVETAGWNHLPANLVSIAAVSLLNFWAGERIVFRSPAPVPEAEPEKEEKA
jgi:putative flippase GtrA